jgi:hypothetical protein
MINSIDQQSLLSQLKRGNIYENQPNGYLLDVLAHMGRYDAFK